MVDITELLTVLAAIMILKNENISGEDRKEDSNMKTFRMICDCHEGTTDNIICISICIWILSFDNLLYFICLTSHSEYLKLNATGINADALNACLCLHDYFNRQTSQAYDVILLLGFMGMKFIPKMN